MTKYGSVPKMIGQFDFDLPEVMHYLYLPVVIHGTEQGDIRLPTNVECC